MSEKRTENSRERALAIGISIATSHKSCLCDQAVGLTGRIVAVAVAVLVYAQKKS